MQCERLASLIKLMFLVLTVGFAYVLIRSLGVSTSSEPGGFAKTENLFADVATGQTVARRVGSDRVWVTRLNSSQRTQAESLNYYMQEAEAGCSIADDLCVVLAATGRSGIDIIFTQQAPAQLNSNIPWFGGFVDPTTGEVFDRLGRVYASTASERTELSRLLP